MQCSTSAAIILALFSIFLGAPLALNEVDQEISNAQIRWASDITSVSQFLSDAESLSPDELAFQAGQAVTTEKDELTHKAVLDFQFLDDYGRFVAVEQANEELTNEGVFNTVLDNLQYLATNVPSMTPAQVSAAVLAINEPRCNIFLPAADAYFQATTDLLVIPPVSQATRPTNCP